MKKKIIEWIAADVFLVVLIGLFIGGLLSNKICQLAIVVEGVIVLCLLLVILILLLWKFVRDQIDVFKNYFEIKKNQKK